MVNFLFRPVFKKEKGIYIYKHHCLPIGCIPVEKNDDGKRILDGWEFFYKGWAAGPNADTDTTIESNTADDGSMDLSNGDGNRILHRYGATEEEMFPEDRLGNLDARVLTALGLKSSTMKTNDFLFFYQLILPICNTQRSGIRNDGRLSYYSKVEEWSNLYACQIGLGGSYGHEFKNVTLKEILQHDGCIIRDGLRGGSSGAIYRR